LATFRRNIGGSRPEQELVKWAEKNTEKKYQDVDEDGAITLISRSMKLQTARTRGCKIHKSIGISGLFSKQSARSRCARGNMLEKFPQRRGFHQVKKDVRAGTIFGSFLSGERCLQENLGKEKEESLVRGGFMKKHFKSKKRFGGK